MANKYRAYNAEIIDARRMPAKYARLLSHPDLRSGLCMEINETHAADFQLSHKQKNLTIFSHYIRTVGNHLYNHFSPFENKKKRKYLIKIQLLNRNIFFAFNSKILRSKIYISKQCRRIGICTNHICTNHFC